MKADTYSGSYEGLMRERKFSRPIILVLAIALLLCVFALMGRDRTVVVVPPGLVGEGDISSNSAGPNVKEAFAAYVATLVGNVTPRSVDYVTQSIGKIVDSRSYKDLIAVVKEQAELVKNEQVTIQFSPTSVFYVPGDDYVAVSGEYAVRGMRDAEKRLIRTYEIGVKVRNYTTYVTSLDVYDGPWRPRGQRQKDGAAKQASAQ